MGWWARDIMGGDAPLDWEDNFYSICKVEKFIEGPNGPKIAPLKKKDIEDNLGKIMQTLTNTGGSIGYQVLSVLMMKAGAVIDQDMKSEFIKRIEADEWAREDEDRKRIIQGLVEALKTYNSKTPIIVRSKGLFEVLAEHISEGKGGTDK